MYTPVEVSPGQIKVAEKFTLHAEGPGGAQHSGSFFGVGDLSKQAAMSEHQETGSSEGTPAADMYPRKILEYMEGFLISKVTFTCRAYTLSLMGRMQGCTFTQFKVIDTRVSPLRSN